MARGGKESRAIALTANGTAASCIAESRSSRKKYPKRTVTSGYVPESGATTDAGPPRWSAVKYASAPVIPSIPPKYAYSEPPRSKR